MTTAVVVDSSSGVSPALAARWGVHVVPLYVEWDGVTYLDQVDLFPDDFYERLARSDLPPKTAAPGPGDFLRVCSELLREETDEVVILTVSSNLSVTFESASLVAREIGHDKVSVVDTRTGAGAQALLAARAAELAAEGLTGVEIASEIAMARQRSAVFIVIETMKYLRASGRISAAKAAAGTATRMNPVIGFTDGSLDLLARPLGSTRAARFVMGQLDAGSRPTRALGMYTDDVNRARNWIEQVSDRFGVTNSDVAPLSPVVGSNCGPGAHGVAVLWGEA